MNELLNFLISHFAFLYDSFGAQFVGSQVHGSNATLVLESADIRLRFVRDRGQLFLDFQSSHYQCKDEWFSYDVVQQLITKEVEDSALLDEKKANFIKHNFQNIAEAFSKINCHETEKTLHEYEKARATRLFG